MSTKYLNTDLEIESLDDLTPIVKEFGEDVICLFHGRVRSRDFASFEIAGYNPSANECIRTFHSLVEGLSTEARAVWNSCSRRILDVGFEAGRDRENCQQTIDHEVLELAGSIGTHLVITVYPPSDDLD